ncbi:MAG TPA: tetratricopeptide repeat protein, partial [Thermoanaerobaculia bacterium]
RLAVDQRGIDVVTSLDDPSGREIRRIDTHLGVFGVETLCFVADQDGSYRVTTSAFDPSVVPGRYQIDLVAVRPATRLDYLRARATEVYIRGSLEENGGTAAGLQIALRDYTESARLWNEAGEPREEGVVLFGYATTLRSLGQVRKAHDTYLEALNLARTGKDRQLEAKLLAALALNNAILGDPEAALAVADNAMAISRSIGDRQNQADVLQSKSGSLHWLGRFQEALECGRQSLVLDEEIHDRTGQAWAWKAIGDAYSALGSSARALRAFDKASELFRATGQSQGLTWTLESAGFLCWQMGAYPRALALYEEALSIAVGAGQHQGEALARNNIGLVRLSMGELEPARSELERALALWRSGGVAHGEALSLHNLGKVYELEGRAGSDALYHEALQIFRRTGEPSGEARVLASMAQAEQKAGSLDDALGRIQESLAIFDSLGQQLAAPDLRRSFLALRQNAYSIAVDILADLDLSRPNQGFAARAFQASERDRARTLIESLTEVRLDISAELPKELSRRESELSARLVRLQKELATSSDRKAAEDRITGAEEEWDALVAEIRRRDPRYASLRYPEPISWEEARRLLGPETAVISFAAMADRFIVFRLTSSGIDLRRLAISRADLEELVENYVSLISREDADRWKELSQRLGAEIVDPWLEGLPAGVRRLIIVPDAAL